MFIFIEKIIKKSKKLMDANNQNLMFANYMQVDMSSASQTTAYTLANIFVCLLPSFNNYILKHKVEEFPIYCFLFQDQPEFDK